MFLDKHNNYFTLMMPIIDILDNLSSRLGFDMSLIAVV